jgi:hypothetical protein
MPQQERPEPTDAESLGLTEDDLLHFDEEVQDESALAEEPEGIGEAPPADAPADPADPLTNASPSGSKMENPDKAPAEPPAPADPATPEPATPDPTPWQFTADGTRVTIGKQLADGTVQLAKDELPVLQRHLADRNAWRQRERQYQEQIQALDPQHNENIILSQLLAEQMLDARKKGEEALYDWAVGFINELPRLRYQAQNAALAKQNELLRNRVTPFEQEQQWQAMEPMVRQGMDGWLDRFVGEKYTDLKPQQAKLRDHLWKHRDRFLVRAQEDDPQAGVRRGELAVNLPAIEAELELAQQMLQESQAEKQRLAAAARNQRVLQKGPKAPPAPSVDSSAVPDAAARPAPKNRLEHRERLRQLAEG